MDDNKGLQRVEDFYLGGKVWTPSDFLGGVDEIITMIKKQGDFSIGADALRSMSALNKLSGITLARMIYELKKVWAEFGLLEDNFYTYMSEFSGVSALTLQRYHDAWVSIMAAPTEIHSQLLAHPMKNLYALGSKLEQGYVPEENEWEALANARNSSEFANVLRGVTDTNPRKNSMTIYLEPDGSLVAWMDGQTKPIGYLMLNNEPLNQKATERIVRSAGIIRRHT